MSSYVKKKERARRPANAGQRARNCPEKTAATYSPAGRSTIGADGLNFSVRDGKRWDPVALATWKGLTCGGSEGAGKKGGEGRQKGKPRAERLGPLVGLGCGVAAYTPAPYQRHRL